MGILALDDADRVIEWQEKPKQPKSDLASMGVYVFSKKALRRWLTEDRVDFGANVIPAMLEAGARVFGYRYNGYWQDVGTIQSYWEANMALLEDDPELDLYDKDWVIHTRSEERAPAKVGPTAQVHRSLISHGCVIDGTVVNSVLSPGVRVDVGAVVRDSIVMFDSVIRSGAVVDRSILDKEVVVGPGAIVGDGPVRRPAEQAASRAASTPASPSSASGRSSLAARASGATSRSRADIRTTDFVEARHQERRVGRATTGPSAEPRRARPGHAAAAPRASRRQAGGVAEGLRSPRATHPGLG